MTVWPLGLEIRTQEAVSQPSRTALAGWKPALREVMKRAQVSSAQVGGTAWTFAKATAHKSGATGLNQDFMTLLVAQLRAQDPLEPLRATEFTSQLAQLQSLSELTLMSQWLRQLVELQAVGPALSLIGQQVEWLDGASGERLSGVVERVEASPAGGFMLIVGEHRLSLDQVLAVSS